MAWTIPQYKRYQVDVAGQTLISAAVDRTDYNSALDIINNWRSAHSFPLNTFTVNLKRRAEQIDDGCLVAQRIKRLSSIAHKLERFRTTRLSQMQDIGGCRAIVATIDDVNDLVSAIKESGIKHKLIKENNYILAPKESGYRGVHLVYRYYSDRSNAYNDLQIEMQFRSLKQHAWATAVETVGTFVHQALKSSIGATDWLKFFSIMGTAIAWQENAPSIPGAPTDKNELVTQLRKYTVQLALNEKLRAYGEALNILEESTDKKARYFLLKLDPSASNVTVEGFKVGELRKASEQYLAVEKELSENSGQDAVLVSVESLASLRRAYPNYFMDTSAFIQLVDEALN